LEFKDLNDQQKEAVDKAMNWYFIRSPEKNSFVLSGYAGTGKSSTLRFIIESLGLDNDSVLFAALTGKAASVLKIKGHQANTIHRTFYQPIPSSNGGCFFKLKRTIPSGIGLIVIDEAAMVEQRMLKDILSYNIPVLMMGDCGQLKPIYGGNEFITMENSDVILTKVMRSSDESGILELATMARNGEIIRPGNYGHSRVLDDKRDLLPYDNYSKVICWKNTTKRALNQMLREDFGYTSVYPIKGEKIVFLNNNYNYYIDYKDMILPIINGLECIILENAKVINSEQIMIKAKPYFIEEDDIYFEVPCSKRIFDSYSNGIIEDLKTIAFEEREKGGMTCLADFAYAITCHSAQGSEYNNVLVMNEMPRYRPEYNNWYYTSITRSISRCDIIDV
jgi:exodeoxyribonuclease-5